MLKIAWSETYKYALPDGHRFPMIKYELLPEQLIYEGTVNEASFFKPTPLSDDLIVLTHTEAYLSKLNHQLLSAKEIRNIGFPMTPQLVQRGKHIANGTYTCTQFAIEHGISMNIAGGTHHSFSDRGEGFCVFNDVAIATNILLKDDPHCKVLIIDLDVHQGNGTAKIFMGQSEVFTFSMHGERNYPTKKERSSLDIGLPDGCDDAFYLRTLMNELPRILDAFQPNFIFYLSGVDVLQTDKLGRLALTKQGCKARDKYVIETAKVHKIPIVICMAGGYSEKLSDIIDAHANTFRLAQEIYF